MKKIKRKSVTLTIIGLIVGMTMSIVFNKSSNILVLIPVAGAIGGLIGTLIDKRNKKK